MSLRFSAQPRIKEMILIDLMTFGKIVNIFLLIYLYIFILAFSFLQGGSAT
jgi:hypothetical protein